MESAELITPTATLFKSRLDANRLQLLNFGQKFVHNCPSNHHLITP
jgi:hypothetical protein